MRKRRIVAVLAIVVLAVAMLAAAAAPALAARPECAEFRESFDNCGTSLEHRADPSGKGNFGQCHKLGAIEGEESRTFNPSSQNSGGADCREVTGRPTETGALGIEVSDICFNLAGGCTAETRIIFPS